MMDKAAIIAQGYEEIKRIPTLPQYKTYTVAVKNTNFNKEAGANGFNDDSFKLFYFLRFRQIAVALNERSKTKDQQGWEFDDFVNSYKSSEVEYTSM